MKKRPLTKRKSATADQFIVVLEDMRSDFRAFGEKLEMVDEKMVIMDGRLGNIEEDLEIIKVELVNINSEIFDLKKLLTHKADLKRLQDLERRVVHLEKIMATRG